MNCPVDDCPLGLVQVDGIHLSPVCPAHGAPSDPICNERGIPQSECPWYCHHDTDQTCAIPPAVAQGDGPSW